MNDDTDDDYDGGNSDDDDDGDHDDDGRVCPYTKALDTKALTAQTLKEKGRNIGKAWREMQSDDDDENAYNDDDLYVIGVCLNVCCKNQLFAMAYLAGHQIFIVGYVKYCWRICSGRVF